MASNTKELIFKVTLDPKDLEKGVKNVNVQIDSIADATEKANEKIQKANEKLTKYSAAVAGALAATGIACTNMAIKFNEGFSAVETLIPGSVDRITELQDAVLALSPAVGKTTEDLTAGLYEVISAFGDSADSVAQLEIAAKAATAGGATTKQSIALLSAVTKGYGDTSATAMQKVSDLAFTTIKLGQTSMPELASSIQRVTALSNTLGVSQEELFAVFSSSTGVIGGAAEVSTQLAAVYNELMKPSSELTKVFSELGVASGTELVEKFGGLTGALNQIKTVADATDKPINTLFGSVEAGRIALYATGAGAEKLASDLEKMKDASSAADEAFTSATTGGVNSFGFQLQQLKLNFQALTIKIGQELIPTFQALLNPIFKGVEWLANLDSTSISLITTIGTMAVTFTGVIAGIGLATKAFAAFNTTLAANPLGAVVAGVSALVIALTSLSKKIDEAKYKLLDESKAQDEKTKNYIAQGNALKGLIKERANLLAIESKSADEEKRLAETQKELFESLKKYHMGFGGGGRTLDGVEAVELDIEFNLSNEEILDKIKEKAEHINRNISYIEAEIEKLEKDKERFDQTYYDGFAGYVYNDKDEKSIAKYNEQIGELQQRILELKEMQSNLYSISAEDFLADETDEPFQFEIQPVLVSGNETKKSFSDRLKELDDLYSYEKQIIENSQGTQKQKQAALEELEQSHYEKRLELLNTFTKERLAKGASYESAIATRLSTQASTIEAEVEKTYERINEIANDQLEKELSEIATIADDAAQEIAALSEKKFNAGDFGDQGSSDAKRSQKNYEITNLQQKQVELSERIKQLTDDDVELHAKKISALEAEVEKLSQYESNARTALNSIGDTTAEFLGKVATQIAEVGSAINQSVNTVSGLATNIIGLQQQKKQQEFADKIAEIEREKNETLMQMEDEYLTWKEERELEAREREEQAAQEQYEKRIAELATNLNETENAFAQETNIEKARNKEKELEAARRAKAEEEQKRKEQEAEKKRQQEERKAEIEMLNAKAQAQWEFQVATIEAQNASGEASAKFAHQQAAFEKAQSITSLIVQSAIETARAAASFAQMDFIGGALHTSAAAVAIAQSGIIGATPLPSATFNPAPLPQAPRAIKFATGGIVYPSSGGTNFTLPNGTPGIAGEAGLPEIILPVSQENLDKVFRSQGITNTQSVNLAPTYNLTIMTDGTETNADKIMTVLREHDRELLALVENTRRMNYID